MRGLGLGVGEQKNFQDYTGDGLDKSILAQDKSLGLALFSWKPSKVLTMAWAVQQIWVMGVLLGLLSTYTETLEKCSCGCAKKSLTLNNRHLPRAEQHVCCQQMKPTRAEEG